MHKHTSITYRLITLLSSQKFFVGIVVLFVVQAAWIALSGKYPMAFDEDFHLGVIRLYADTLMPFWSQHPNGAEIFGAVTRDPSYLFHYLMSFPYLLLQQLTDNQSTHVIALRAMNIAFFATGIVLWRKVLLKTGASKAIVHMCLLVLVLVPVVPLLGAQLNYDNLLMLFIPLVLLYAIKFGQELEKYKRVHTQSLLLLAITAMTASLIKYAFLPIFVAIFVYVIYSLWRTKEPLAKLALSFGFGWTTISRGLQWVIIGLLLVTSVLFIERYGVNVVKYHTPVPDCSQVLTIDECRKYGPWGRNYRIMNDPTINNSSLATYTADWFHGMWLRSFFAVDGPGSGFQARAPFLLPGITVIFLTIIAVAALFLKAKTVWHRYNSRTLWLLSSVSVFYVAALWLNGLRDFLRLGQSVAINGRYLVLVAPILLLISVLALNELFNTRRSAKVITSIVIISLLVWGGGAATYVLRSNNAWYWNNSAIRTINGSIRDAVGPVVPGYYSPTKFLWRN